MPTFKGLVSLFKALATASSGDGGRKCLNSARRVPFILQADVGDESESDDDDSHTQQNKSAQAKKSNSSCFYL